MGCTMGGGAPKRQEHPLEALLVMIYKEMQAMTNELIVIRCALTTEQDEDVFSATLKDIAGLPESNGDSVN